MSRYWISPQGEIVAVSGSHEDYVRYNPGRFGLKHGDEIRFGAIFKKKWIRVRIYSSNEITFELDRLDAASSQNIVNFLRQQKFPPDATVTISAVGEKLARHATIEEIMKGKLNDVE